MEICSEGHAEIVHDHGKCPFCIELRIRDEQIEELQEEIEEMKDEEYEKNIQGILNEK